MSDKVIDQAELSKLMSDSWSWQGGGSSGTFSTDELIDPVTGKHYKLHVEDGKLTMTEVTS